MPGNTRLVADSAYSWLRLTITLIISVLTSAGMWTVVVLMPTFEADFDLSRAEASYPYMIVMVGFVIGGIVFGRAVDHVGMTPVLMVSTALISGGFLIGAWASSFPSLLGGLFVIGTGTAAGFAPLLADISHWFHRRRGLAISIAASGSYLSGVLWPLFIGPILEYGTWREAHIVIASIIFITVMPLSLFLRRRAPANVLAEADLISSANRMQAGLSSRSLGALLALAGLGCCVAMAMPQVHLVALCVDRGFGLSVGSQMLSMTLMAGIFSRLIFGAFTDKLGGMFTLLLGSTLQMIALSLYLFSEGLTSLYIVSLIFGLSQGGILPAYSVIIREYLPSRDAGGAISLVMSATVVGMAFGGWLSGWIYGVTGSYTMAFANGMGWNLLNLIVVVILLLRSYVRPITSS